MFALFVALSAASLIPIMKSAKPETHAFGPFTTSVEMINGRGAMIGFAALLVLENLSGRALLS